MIEPLTNGEVIRAEQRGCLVLSLNGWKKIRRTKTRFEVMERINSTCDKLIGNINNDTFGRGTVVAAMQKQIWRDISGYEGRYQVSNFGRGYWGTCQNFRRQPRKNQRSSDGENLSVCRWKNSY
ncbi:MAG: hypothetical protein IJ685_09415 [Selenomonadaceae bacterium]|nr:hypothetical protein [Selenomonadaceae bacterium]